VRPLVDEEHVLLFALEGHRAVHLAGRDLQDRPRFVVRPRMRVFALAGRGGSSITRLLDELDLQRLEVRSPRVPRGSGGPLALWGASGFSAVGWGGPVEEAEPDNAWAGGGGPVARTK